jgi:hypothetical protein
MYEIEAVVLNRLFDSNSYNEATFRCFENPEQHGTHAYISKDDFLRIRDSVRKGVPVA